jgi:hypothetical protein
MKERESKTVSNLSPNFAANPGYLHHADFSPEGKEKYLKYIGTSFHTFCSIL